ncbi:Vps54-domain-containing protein [Rhizoclosmatium globosum]|uniref:Vps54-domain-containing protein n=1 Tax=Rhizoclosmatium globosum TaxID=329046 RepID=A0A1Y2C0E5_9FUNG|nr:Vps54-domain-containing protein [Rhizoclosmatium globosum]|eukprot:ORY40384.1 Vps54-domain-containing protein [Rhizoclosmatium globosum]
MDALALVPATAVRRVKAAEFEQYTKLLEPVLDRYTINQTLGPAAIEGAPMLGSLEQQLESGSFIDLVMATERILVDTNKRNKGDRMAHRRLLAAHAPPLDTVPELFFAKDFKLGNPATFSDVYDKADLANSLWPMSISPHRSFFNALSTLQALHHETQSCIDQIHHLRARMATLTANTITPGLTVSRLSTRKNNVQRLHDSVEKIFKVQNNQSVIDAFVRQRHLSFGAQNTNIVPEETAEDVAAEGGEQVPQSVVATTTAAGTTDPKSGTALTISTNTTANNASIQQKQDQLQQQTRTYPPRPTPLQRPYQKSIALAFQMEHEFTEILVHEVRTVAGQVDPSTFLAPSAQGTAIEGWIKNIFNVDVTKSSSEALAALDEGLEFRLTPICLQQYKQSLMREIKALTKRSSRKTTQTMSFDSFLDLLVSIYTLLLHIFQKSSAIHAITTAVIQKAEQQGIHIGPSSVTNSTEQLARKKKLGDNDDDDDFGSDDLFSLDPATDALMEEKKREEEQMRMDTTAFAQLIAESNELLLAISEAANARCAKLMSVRSDQNAKLSPKDFYRLLGATKEFISASEYLELLSRNYLCRKQAKSFLNHFHDERSKQIVIVIENEQWSRAEVPIDFQKSGALAVEKKKAAKAAAGEDEEFDDEELSALVFAHKEAAAAASADELVARNFTVAGCVLLLTKMLTEYLQGVENMPSLATEVLNKTLDLLKVFNSRICQVILGAGATKSAGLKNINAGHIAPLLTSAISLTAQSLGAVIGYIPHLKAAIEHHLPPKQHNLLVDFDRILKDYKEHQTALYDKLVTIMQERLAYHAKNLLTVNWDAPDAKDMTSDQACSIHIGGLVKETQTMHRAYNKGLEEELKKIELYTSAGKNRLLMDGQHLMAELSALDDVDGPGNSIEVVINNIKIRDKSQKSSVTSPVGTGPGSGSGTPAIRNTTTVPPPSTKSKNLFSKWKD